ncbi:MAG: hypothetical protein CO035_05530, partial [Candidatus Omnitrophica bacterium CG_4_9_14_0_2_um_filter_42_8]
ELTKIYQYNESFQYRGRISGWLQSGKKDSLSQSFGLDENGYKNMQVDLTYNQTTGKITREYAHDGEGWTEWQDNSIMYASDGDRGGWGEPGDFQSEIDNLNAMQSNGDYKWEFIDTSMYSWYDWDSSIQDYIGGTDYYINIKEKHNKKDIGYDHYNLTYDFLGRPKSGSYREYNNKTGQFEVSHKSNMHYYASGKLKGYDETLDNKEKTTTHVRNIKYDALGGETSRYIWGNYTNDDGQKVTFDGYVYTNNQYFDDGILKSKTVNQELDYHVHKSGWWLFGAFVAIVAALFTMGASLVFLIPAIALATVSFGVALSGGYSTSTHSSVITQYTYSYDQKGRNETEKVLKEEQNAVWNFWRIVEIVAVVAVAAIVSAVAFPLLGPLAGLLASLAGSLTQWMMNDFKTKFSDHFTMQDLVMAFVMMGANAVLQELFDAIGSIFNEIKDGIEKAGEAATTFQKVVSFIVTYMPSTLTAFTVALVYTFVKWAIGGFKKGEFKFDTTAYLIIAGGILKDIQVALDKIGSNAETAEKDKSFLTKVKETVVGAINDVKDFLTGGDKQFSFEGKKDVSVFNFFQGGDDALLLYKKIIAGVIHQIAMTKVFEAYRARKREEEGL